MRIVAKMLKVSVYIQKIHAHLANLLHAGLPANNSTVQMVIPMMESSYGRPLPSLVCVLSTMTPATISVTASTALLASSRVLTVNRFTPSVSDA